MSIAMPTVHLDDQPEQREWMRDDYFASHNGVAGRLRAHGLSDAERHLAVAMHLSPIVGLFFPIAFLAPLVIWLIRKDSSHFNNDHGREVVNFLLSFLVLHLMMIIACLTIIGIPVAIVGVVVLWVSGFINLFRGAFAAGRGEFFRYPMTIRFLS